MANTELHYSPEGVSGESWTVVEARSPSGMMVDLEHRVALVTPASTPGAELNRLHELGHVAFTDIKEPTRDLFGRCQAALEEIRVDLLVEKHTGVSMKERHDEYMGSLALDVDKMERIQLAEFCLQSYVQRNSKKVNATYTKARQLLYDKTHIDIATYAGSISVYVTLAERDRLARTLAEILETPPPPSPLPEHLTGSFSHDGIKDGRSSGAPRPKAEASDTPGSPATPRAMGGDLKQVDLGDGKSTSLKLAPYEIHDHIKLSLHTKAARQPYGASDKGTVPNRMERLIEDAQIFKRSRRTGSILIDTSGSMSWDWGVLQNLVKLMPAMVIATYWGIKDHGLERLTTPHGRLCIIAGKGRWSGPAKEGNPGANAIDVECLLWLAQQPGPRLWLSDGGVSSSVHSDPRDLCTKIMLAHNICMTQDMGEATKYMERKFARVSTICDQNETERLRAVISR